MEYHARPQAMHIKTTVCTRKQKSGDHQDAKVAAGLAIKGIKSFTMAGEICDDLFTRHGDPVADINCFAS